MALLLTICAAVFALGAFLAADAAREERKSHRDTENDVDYPA